MRTKPIATEFSKYGYTFQQIDRAGRVAIYSQTRNDNGRLTGYEVVAIQLCQAREEFKAHAGFDRVECYPSSEQWGTYAFTVDTLPRAYARAVALARTETERRHFERKLDTAPSQGRAA